MHSFAIRDLVSKSSDFIDIFTSRQPTYLTAYVTPGPSTCWSVCSQPRAGRLTNPDGGGWGCCGGGALLGPPPPIWDQDDAAVAILVVVRPRGVGLRLASGWCGGGEGAARFDGAGGEAEDEDITAVGPFDDVRLAGFGAAGLAGVGGAWHCGGDDDTHVLP